MDILGANEACQDEIRKALDRQMLLATRSIPKLKPGSGTGPAVEAVVRRVVLPRRERQPHQGCPIPWLVSRRRKGRRFRVNPLTGPAGNPSDREADLQRQSSGSRRRPDLATRHSAGPAWKWCGASKLLLVGRAGSADDSLTHYIRCPRPGSRQRKWTATSPQQHRHVRSPSSAARGRHSNRPDGNRGGGAPS